MCSKLLGVTQHERRPETGVGAEAGRRPEVRASALGLMVVLAKGSQATWNVRASACGRERESRADWGDEGGGRRGSSVPLAVPLSVPRTVPISGAARSSRLAANLSSSPSSHKLGTPRRVPDADRNVRDHDAGVGVLDWFNSGATSSGKSPSKIFERWQSETLKLREEVVRLEMLLFEEGQARSEMEQTKDAEFDLQRRRLHEDKRRVEAALDSERLAWARAQSEMAATGEMRNTEHSMLVRAMGEEKVRALQMLEEERQRRTTDAEAWKKALALVELETKRQVQNAKETLERERDSLRRCKADLSTAHNVEEDLRSRLERSESERRLLVGHAHSEKDQLLEEMQREREQTAVTGNEKLLALKASLESEIGALEKDRTSLEANLCDEIARHVMTQALLEKESTQCKTLAASNTALSQETAWMSGKLTEMEVALNASEQRAASLDAALASKQQALDEAHAEQRRSKQELSVSQGLATSLASQLSAAQSDLAFARSAASEHATGARILQDRLAIMSTVVASVETLLGKGVEGATDNRHRLRQALHAADLVRLQVEHGRQELALRVETTSKDLAVLHQRLLQVQEEGAAASAAYAEELDKQRAAHAREQSDAVALREDLRREHQRERELQREVSSLQYV